MERASAPAHKFHKDIKENGDKANKEALKLLGVNGRTQIIKYRIANMKEPTLEGQPGFLAHSVQGAIRAVLELRTRIGKAKMNVMTEGQEFVRCVSGTTGTRVQVIVSYVCQECDHAPKFDFDYIVMMKCGARSGWYCTYCGCL